MRAERLMAHPGRRFSMCHLTWCHSCVVSFVYLAKNPVAGGRVSIHFWISLCRHPTLRAPMRTGRGNWFRGIIS